MLHGFSGPDRSEPGSGTITADPAIVEAIGGG